MARIACRCMICNGNTSFSADEMYQVEIGDDWFKRGRGHPRPGLKPRYDANNPASVSASGGMPDGAVLDSRKES